MTANVLAELMTDEGGCTKDNDKLLVPKHTATTLYATIGDESLIVDRVVSLKLGNEVAVAATSRGERYALAFEDIRAVRFAGGSGGAGYR